MKKLPLGTIQKLQRYISVKIQERGFEDESLEERLLLLTEELGELIIACRRVKGIGHVKKENKEYNMGHEIADILNMLFSVADCLNINVEQAFLEKEAEIEKRSYTRIDSN